MKKLSFIVVILFILMLCAMGLQRVGGISFFNEPESEVIVVSEQKPTFTVPKGFEMSVYADNIPDARVMAFGPSAEILISEPGEGKIVAIVDSDGDGKADIKNTVVSKLNKPHGMAFNCTTVAGISLCDLYIAEKNALSVFSYDSNTMKATNKKKLLDLPNGGIGTHSTRSLVFMPYPNQTTLLISVGSSCNVCNETDINRASIIAYDISTGESHQFARGLRNSVFMVPHFVTGDIWATEMGRDGLGDDNPPDEINILKEGGNYGWPICYGKNIHDGEFDKNTYIRNPCMAPLETPSHIDITAHSAPLGLDFIPEEGWDESMWYDAIVAYHGSWNRSVPTGYKIVRMKLDHDGDYEGKSPQTEDFITGWMQDDGKIIGRPVDIKILSGGVMYITDDKAGMIYKMMRTGNEPR